MITEQVGTDRNAPYVAIGTAGNGGLVWYPLFYGGDSVTNGLIFGGAGAGTTYFAAALTAAVRAAVPTITVHLDPFEGGTSSRALSEHATHAFHGPEETPIALEKLERLTERRQLECAAENAVAHCGPLILVVAHAPALLFEQTRAERWFQVLRVGRKLRMSLLAVGGNSCSLAEFGSHPGLRGLITNVVGMRSLGTMAAFGPDAPTLRTLGPREAVMTSTLAAGRQRFMVPEVEPAEVLARYPDTETGGL